MSAPKLNRRTLKAFLDASPQDVFWEDVTCPRRDQLLDAQITRIRSGPHCR
jgi:hypothetical protein